MVGQGMEGIGSARVGELRKGMDHIHKEGNGTERFGSAWRG